MKFLDTSGISIIKDCVDLLYTDKEAKSTEILRSMLQSFCTCFSAYDTEYKRLKHFENSLFYNRPMEIKLGCSPDHSNKNSSVSLVLKDRYASYISLKKSLKSFLELPGNFACINEYQDKLAQCDNSVLFNICNGSLWKNIHKSYKGKEVFPLILYFDDFETANPLGSHAGVYKLGGVYFSLPTIPPEYSSRLENIFLALLFHSIDRTRFGNSVVFKCLINELKDLQDNGIKITVDSEVHKVYFQLLVIIGDNLGIHSIFGLVESFSANHYCRFCTSTKAETATQVEQLNSNLRLKTEYEIHLSEKKFGIKELCVWHEISHFNIYDNLYCDVMHDLFEGVHRYDMAQIIKKLILNKHFTLDVLNSRIKYFKYEPFEKNIPPPLKWDHINSGCIIMLAAEMLCLVRNFRFIIGDLVPSDSYVWEFYLIVLEITEILTSSVISTDTINLLAYLIKEHNLLYISIFKQSLKPKFHFLVHYPTIIFKIGPPILISSMRYEAKHQELKCTAGITKCKKIYRLQ